MKFSTVAASAVLFSSVVIAMPNKVVYETEVVTITSCAPEVVDCPYATPTPEPYPEVPEPEPETTSCTTEEVEPTPEPEVHH